MPGMKLSPEMCEQIRKLQASGKYDGSYGKGAVTAALVAKVNTLLPEGVTVTRHAIRTALGRTSPEFEHGPIKTTERAFFKEELIKDPTLTAGQMRALLGTNFNDKPRTTITITNEIRSVRTEIKYDANPEKQSKRKKSFMRNRQANINPVPHAQVAKEAALQKMIDDEGSTSLNPNYVMMTSKVKRRKKNKQRVQ